MTKTSAGGTRTPRRSSRARARASCAQAMAFAAMTGAAATIDGGAARADGDAALRLWQAGTFEPVASGPALRESDPTGNGTSLAALMPADDAVPERARKKATAPLPAPHAMQLGKPGPYSHLAWHSGASCGAPDFESWRQRKLDVITGWAPASSYPAMVKFSTGLHKIAAQPAWFTVGVPMVTSDKKGQLGNCAKGAFDSYYRQFAQNLAGNKMTDSIIRIGWEGNGDWFPWSAVGKTTEFKQCFKRIAQIFKHVSPGFRIEWPMVKKGRVFPVSQLYPGDSIVDIVGITFYDRFPNYPTQEVWNKELAATIKGGPFGIQSWLNFAKAHGKKLAVAEWGINNRYPQGGKYGMARDEPNYVANMFNFFKKNATSIAYETVFNCDHPTKGEKYVLYPVKDNPKSSATYRKLWGKG